jgi:diadenosine tetraphosphate (Ap4A) HIT family hydrolase
VPHSPDSVPAYTKWPSFPFEGDLRVKKLATPVDAEPRRKGEDAAECIACNTPDDAYIWVSERWRVRAMERPTGLPMVLILEARSHLDLGDLPNLLAAELGVMTVRLERAVRSLDGVARVHVNRWGDSSAHLHMWFLARPYGQLQLRGTFLSLWDDILPPIAESVWRENLALVAAWLAEFGGTALAEPPHIEWQAPSSLTPRSTPAAVAATVELVAEPLSVAIAEAPEGSDSAPVPDTSPAPLVPPQPVRDGRAPVGVGGAAGAGAGAPPARPVAAGKESLGARLEAAAAGADGTAPNGGEAVSAPDGGKRAPAPVVVAGSGKPTKP